MTTQLSPLKRCARCLAYHIEHARDGDRYLCPNGAGEFNPVTVNWAEFQRPVMEKAEEIYERRPMIHRGHGLSVPFEDATPEVHGRCVEQAKVEIWTGTRQKGPHA